MISKIAFTIGLLCGTCAVSNAQTKLVIFLNDGTTLQVPTTEIDSLTYSSPGIGALASVTLSPVTTVFNGIRLSGSVVEEGGAPVTARGFCYGTLPSPTTADNVIDMGSGIGVMDSLLSGLAANGTHYVRAYATNLFGTAFSASLGLSFGSGSALPGNGVVDIDGNAYPSVIIGNTEWMAVNLRTVHYANGDPIYVPATDFIWSHIDSAACGSLFQFRDYDHYDFPYGKLYNGYAVTDPRNVCPAGWRLPTPVEMHDLIYSTGLGAGPNTQINLSEAGPEHWGTSNTAINSFGFTAIPAGGRSSFSGDLDYLNSHAQYWTDYYTGNSLIGVGSISFPSGGVVGQVSGTTRAGNSVRCVRN